MMTDATDLGEVPRDSPTLFSVISAFSTMAFAYGGTMGFPTVQNDMKEPEKFPRSVFFAIISE